MALDNEWNWALTILSVFSITIGLLALLCNSFCLFAMIVGHVLQQNASFRLVALLCVADAVQGLAYMISGVTKIMTYVDIVPAMTAATCYVALLPSTIGSAFTCTCMMAVAAERFFLVAFPLTYMRNSRLLINVSVPIIVSVGLIIGLAGFAGMIYDKPVWPCNVSNANHPMWLSFAGNGKLAGLGLTVVLYTATAVMYRLRKAKVSASLSTGGKENAHVEVTKMALTICLVYVICAGTGTIGVTFIGGWIGHKLLAATVTQVCSIMTVVNCWVNVFIFPAKSKDMKRAMKMALGCRRGVGSNVSTNQPQIASILKTPKASGNQSSLADTSD